MSGDGRNSFFRLLNLDKDTKRLLYWFREIKKDMINEQDNNYVNGKIYEEKK